GENLPAAPWEASLRAIDSASAVLVIGTSGLVHPAASLPDLAAENGTPVVEVNPGDSGLGPAVTAHVRATAGDAVPALLPRCAAKGGSPQRRDALKIEHLEPREITGGRG